MLKKTRSVSFRIKVILTQCQVENGLDLNSIYEFNKSFVDINKHPYNAKGFLILKWAYERICEANKHFGMVYDSTLIFKRHPE